MIWQDDAERGIKEIDRNEKGTEGKRSMWPAAKEIHIDLLNLSFKVQSTTTVFVSFYLLWRCGDRHGNKFSKSRQWCRVNVATVCQDLCRTLVVCGIIQERHQDFSLNQITFFLPLFAHLVVFWNESEMNFTAKFLWVTCATCWTDYKLSISRCMFLYLAVYFVAVILGAHFDELAIDSLEDVEDVPHQSCLAHITCMHKGFTVHK